MTTVVLVCDVCGKRRQGQDRRGWTRLPAGWLALDEGIESLAVVVCSDHCADIYEAREAELVRLRVETLGRFAGGGR